MCVCEHKCACVHKCACMHKCVLSHSKGLICCYLPISPSQPKTKSAFWKLNQHLVPEREKREREREIRGNGGGKGRGRKKATGKWREEGGGSGGHDCSVLLFLKSSLGKLKYFHTHRPLMCVCACAFGAPCWLKVLMCVCMCARPCVPGVCVCVCVYVFVCVCLHMRTPGVELVSP